MNGGYEDGYKSCACFWGRKPGRLVEQVASMLGDVRGLDVLDAGCGEGKNAAFFAGRGATVRAVDVSVIAIEHARNWFGDIANVSWEIADIRQSDLSPSSFDIVIAYGLPHCLASEAEVIAVLERLKMATKADGLNVVCSFNERRQELSAHPGFAPTLLHHAKYLDLYSDWQLPYQSDEDLTEVHPNNGIRHTHSLTRLIAKRCTITT
jgi:SAM-dependent methyltransferase